MSEPGWLTLARQVSEGRSHPQEFPTEAFAAVVSLAGELRQVDDLLREHERLLRRYGPSDTLIGRLGQVINHYQDNSVRTARIVQQFRDDLIVQLRAFSLVVDMAGSATTHAEKNARLRGLSELIEGSVAKLREFQFTDLDIWSFPDMFRSDYPTRVYLQRIRTLEEQVRALSADGAPEAPADPTSGL